MSSNVLVTRYKFHTVDDPEFLAVLVINRVGQSFPFDSRSIKEDPGGKGQRNPFDH